MSNLFYFLTEFYISDHFINTLIQKMEEIQNTNYELYYFYYFKMIVLMYHPRDTTITLGRYEKLVYTTNSKKFMMHWIKQK